MGEPVAQGVGRLVTLGRVVEDEVDFIAFGVADMLPLFVCDPCFRFKNAVIQGRVFLPLQPSALLVRFKLLHQAFAYGEKVHDVAHDHGYDKSYG